MEAWQQNLRVLWAAQFVAMIGMSACIPFLPLYVRTLGVPQADAAFWSSLVYGAPFVMSSLLTPVWGILGDRYGQKTMVMRAIAGLAVSMTLMGFAPNVWVLVALRMFQGAASGFVASNNAFVSAQTPQERIGASLATLQTSIAAGSVVGPLLGGVVADAFGMRMVFFVVGSLCAVSLVILWVFLHESRGVVVPRQARVFKNIRIVLRTRSLRDLLVLLFCTQTALVLVTPVLPYYIQELGAPEASLGSIVGLIVSLVGVGSVISSRWWGQRSDRRGFVPTMRVALSIVLAGTVVQSVVPTYHWLIPIRATVGLAAGAILPLVYGALSRRSPAGRKGGIMGMASSATLLGNMTGPALCSTLSVWLPTSGLFVVAASLMALSLWMVTSRVAGEDAVAPTVS